MLQLYYAPDNASLILRLAMEEGGVPYETVLVNRAARAQKEPEYLALNPAGLIPTLITPHGALSETGACLLWLVDTYPDANLGPSMHDEGRVAFLRWLFYLSNTVHPDLNRVFNPDRFVPAENAEQYYTATTNRLLGHFEILDAAVRDDSSLFEPPSALALYIGPILRWSALYPVSGRRWFDLDAFPALRELAASLEARPSVEAGITAEGLGDTPFTKPQLPNPPEGSAT